MVKLLFSKQEDIALYCLAETSPNSYCNLLDSVQSSIKRMSLISWWWTLVIPWKFMSDLSQVYGKTYVFSDFGEVWVFQRWTVFCNTWYFVLLLAFPTYFSLETSRTRGDNCALTGVHAPGLANTNSLRVLKGLKSTARFTNRSFQLHNTLWLDRNGISYTILIQFAVTEDFVHCPSGLLSESSDSLGEASSPTYF